MLMDAQVERICRYIADDIVELARKVMESPVGVNEKTGANTLVDSELYRKIGTDFRDEGEGVVIETLFNHYIEYIERDRPPMYGKRPPIDAIVKWLRTKHIVSSNENIRSVAYLISRAIWRDGHKGRRIMETLGNKVDERFDYLYADRIFDFLTEELDRYFKD